MCEDPGEAEKVGFSGNGKKANVVAKVREKKRELRTLSDTLTITHHQYAIIISY